MFRVIGGIVVYGFALYGAVTLVGRMKVIRPIPGDLKSTAGESTDEFDRQADERRAATQVGT